MSVIWADLGLASTLTRTCQHPGIVWDFRGLHERLNQRGETIEAAHMQYAESNMPTLHPKADI